MSSFSLRPIRASDNAKVASIIRSVMPEFGASGPGFAIHDKEVDTMFEVYTQPRHAYFVVEYDGDVVGGGGVGPLWGGPDEICELRKMYFLPVARGKGQGEALLQRCITAAKELGFRTIYLETLNSMTAAMRLYEKLGFIRIPGPIGKTGHFGCDKFYTRSLAG